MRARAVFAFTVAAALVAVAPAWAAPQVHFVLSDDAPAYRAVADAARAAFGTQAVTTVGAVTDPVPAESAVIVTVGTAATQRWAGSDDPRPVVATLVPAAAWAEIVPLAAPNRSAIYLDQPLARQVALVRVLLPPLRELGVLFGPSSAAVRPELAAAAARFGVLVNEHQVGIGEELNGAVTQVLRDSEALLALPDQQVFNRYNVQSVLLASFRLRRPVVGYSESWVRAGALAALYSTPTQLGTEVAGSIMHWLPTGGPLPPAGPAAGYALAVNRQVAFSLGLNLPPDAVLLQRLRALLEAAP